MTKPGDEYLDDPNFSLRFVNKKSHERVLELVDEIKTAFRQQTVEVDPAPSACLDRVDANPELLFLCPYIKELGKDPNPPPVAPSRLSALKPFLFPFYPATVPKGGKADDDFEKVRHDFLTKSRLEHERLLWAFQDRLVHDLSSCDDQFRPEPFQTPSQMAKEQALPVPCIDKKGGPWQARLNAVLKKTQKQTSAVLEAQRRQAKLLMEAQLFELNYAKLLKNESVGQSEQEFELPVSCPFSFLVDSA
jgi:hypothetical protein